MAVVTPRPRSLLGGNLQRLCWARWTTSWVMEMDRIKGQAHSLWLDEGTPTFLLQWADVHRSILMPLKEHKEYYTILVYYHIFSCVPRYLSIELICWQFIHVMLVMSCSSTTNEPESCSSEGSSCTTSSITTSDPSSMSKHPHSTLPSLSDTPDTSKHETPPPPPLPPPPPVALPPPPPLATMSANHNARKKRRVRSFFWKPIPEEKVRGKPNIWTMAVRQQQFQIDVRSVEELFGQQEDAVMGTRGVAPTPGTSARVSRSRSFKESSKDEVSGCD